MFEVPVFNVFFVSFQEVFTLGLEVGDFGRGFVPQLVGDSDVNLHSFSNQVVQSLKYDRFMWSTQLNSVRFVQS